MERVTELQRVGFLRHLGADVLEAIASIGHRQEVERGQMITLEGEPAEAMYIVLSGRVKISRYSQEGHEQIMYTVGPGDHFNTVPIFDDGPCPAMTEALAPTRLLILPRGEMRLLITRFPALAEALLKEFASRLRHLVGLVEDLALHTVHGRLARLLLLQAEAAERGQQHAPLTQAEIAAHLGTVREMVSRALKAFEAGGLISLERGAIRLLDREGLRLKAES
jgi:CRP-like cAMP-binding protein